VVEWAGGPRRAALTEVAVMAKWLMMIAGAVLVVAGIVWTLQGVGEVGGSFMSGNSTWAVIGPVTALAGLAIAVPGLVRLVRGGRG
jgi:hypothetical protein